MHLRIARGTDKLADLLSFYRDCLGFKVVSSFNAEAVASVVLGFPGAGFDLQFIEILDHKCPPGPQQDDVLAFYIPDQDAFNLTVDRIKSRGFKPLKPPDPHNCVTGGVTFKDPDGYPVNLLNEQSYYVELEDGVQVDEWTML